MEKPNFKFIKGECQSGYPADICFYTDVDYWSVDSFLWEFDYLINYIHPSKIRIHINSVGGTVVDGMSVFAKIMDCKIPTECINDALAASMGSIIWAAGDELYMKDYALLMIHNPFCDCSKDKVDNQMITAFTHQLKIIYMKRFGLDEAGVEEIMNGKEGEDGTFLTAAQAIEKGFVKADHIIETPSVMKDQIRAAIKDSTDVNQLKAVFNLAINTLPQSTNTKKIINTNSKTMDNNEIAVFAALFGLTGDKATTENVTAKVNELKAKADRLESLEKSLTDTKAELTRAQAELTGAQTSINNLTEDLNKTKAALQQYQDAETAAKEQKIQALIDKAVADCKINQDERELYTRMATNDFELAENVLDKIPARNNIGKIISESNKTNAQSGLQSDEEAIKAKVLSVVGDNFKFRTLD